MNKIPCETIQDLMPSYIDQLTSEASNELIKQHLEECESCRSYLDAMKGPQTGTAPEAAESDAPEQKKEIDFLKKNKKRNKAILIGSLCTAAALIGIILFVRLCLVGNRMSADSLALDTTVDGKKVTIEGTVTDSIHAAAPASVKEENGEVNVYVNEVMPSAIYDDTLHVYLEGENEVRVVRINDRTIWENGQRISGNISALYETRHDYCGDPSANNRTANALHLAEIFGTYKNELLTSEEPFTWKLLLNEELTADNRVYLESKMEEQAYLILAVIGNLNAVTFDYMAEGSHCEKTITASEVTEFFGQDVKDCMEDVTTLQKLSDMLSFQGTE